MEPDLIPYSASTGIAARTVLVLAPHADDEVFGCGGALALHAATGARIHVVILTDDTDPEAARVRRAESLSAAHVLGHGDPMFWGIPDRSLAATPALVRRVADLLRETGADLVYAPSPFEVHPDHRQASQAAAGAVADVGGELRLAFYEVGNTLRPNMLVDITPVLARKRRAMRSFASQLARQNYLRHINALNEYRTYTLPPAVQAAEAFWLVTAGEIADGLLAPQHLPVVSPGIVVGNTETAGGDWPLVSVLIRSMDRPWLAEALDSVALQTYPRIEVVVVAATQAHAPLPAHCGPFPLRLVPTGEPLARSAAANRAIDKARGDLLLLLDDDDWLLPSHIARLAWVLRHLSGTRAAYTGVELVDDEHRPLGQVLDLPWDRVRHKAGNLMPIHAVLFDAALARREGCRFDESLEQYEDWDFWLQIARHTTPAHLPGSSAAYRLHDSSGVHREAGPRSAAATAIYDKWQTFWTPADKGSLMERVWAFPDAESARMQAQEFAAQKEAEAQELARKAMQQHEAELQRHRAEIDRLLVTLQSVHEAYAHSHAAARTQAVASAQAQAQVQARALHDKDVHITNLEAMLAELRAQDARWQHEVQALRNSSSWRITRPLRAASRLLRGQGLRHAPKHMPASAPVSVAPTEQPAGPAPITMHQIPTQVHAQPPASAGTHDYTHWALHHDTLDEPAIAALREAATAWDSHPVVSVVMPVYNPPLDLLREAIASVEQQAYPHWELCIADDASPDPDVGTLLDTLAQGDPRIKVVRRPVNGHISEASNSALALATGEFVALLDNDDILPADALFRVVEAVRARPTAQVIYSDEDKLDAQGLRFGPYFKPDWNYTLFLCHNLISHLGVYRRQLLLDAGGFRKGLEGSQDYDLALRCIERVDAADIVHIPRVLYHWRAIEGSTALCTDAKPYALHAAQQALEEHFQRVGPGATVDILDTANYRTLPADLPACDDVSVILLGSDGTAPGWVNDPAYGVREVLFSPGDAAGTAAAIGRAQGALIALVRADARPSGPQALRDLARFSNRSGVASAAGTLRDPTGHLVRGGLVLDAQSTMAVAHSGLPRGHAGYMGRALLAQELSALSADCIVLSHSALDAVGPLDAAAGSLLLSVVDWCLRAGDLGLRSVWNPPAEWEITQDTADALALALAQDRDRPEASALRARHARWFARDPAYHPFFNSERGDFTLLLPVPGNA